MQMKRTLVICLLLLGSANASAAPLTVVNPGFEDLYFGNLPGTYSGDVPPTAFPTGPAPTGWSPFGTVSGGAFIGVLNPGVMAIEPMATYFPAGAPEGDNVALMFFNASQGGPEFGIEQTLADTLQPRTTYTLSVEVGNIASGTSVEPILYAGLGFFDLRGFPGYRIDLLAGGTVIASDNNTLLPGEGEFLTSTISVDIGDNVVPGQALSIRLVSLNNEDVIDLVVDLEVDFDDIQLDASPLISADFDEDDDVDGRDFLTWQRGFGGGPLLSDGNANGDLDINADDLLIWEQMFGNPPALVAFTAVPEPSSMFLVCSALAVLLGRWRGR